MTLYLTRALLRYNVTLCVRLSVWVMVGWVTLAICFLKDSVLMQCISMYIYVYEIIFVISLLLEELLIPPPPLPPR